MDALVVEEQPRKPRKEIDVDLVCHQDAREEQQYSSSIGIHFAASVVT